MGRELREDESFLLTAAILRAYLDDNQDACLRLAEMAKDPDTLLEAVRDIKGKSKPSVNRAKKSPFADEGD